MIEALEDWNERLEQCGCCAMPVCPEPQIECESKNITLQPCGLTAEQWFVQLGGGAAEGLVPCEDAGKRWMAATASSNETVSFDQTIGGQPDYSYTETQEFGCSWTKGWEDDEEWVEGEQCEEHGRVCGGQEQSNAMAAYSFESTTQDGEWVVTESGSGSVSGVGSTTNVVLTTTSTEPDFESTTRTVSIATRCPSNFPAIDVQWTGSGFLEEGGQTYEDSGGGIESTTTEEWTYSISLSEPVDVSAMQIEANLRFGRMTCYPGAACVAMREIEFTECGDPLEEVEDSPVNWVETRVRYRWVVPEEHAGSYFKIEWDEIFFPAGWDSGEPGAPLPEVTPKSWEWSGGDRESAWSMETAVPEGERGSVEVCNVRWICYRSPFGSKPQYSDGFPRYTPPE